MLSTTKRQEYLKYLGFSDYKALQKKYMNKPTGKYDNETDNLLVTAYNCKKYGEGFFSPSEFRCKCGGKYCHGFPAPVNAQLIKNITYLRKDSDKPISIQSGLRCKTWNKLQSGSATQSRHMSGLAVDIYSAVLTNTKAQREKLIQRWYSFKKANYAYGNTSNMGRSVHLDVKK